MSMKCKDNSSDNENKALTNTSAAVALESWAGETITEIKEVYSFPQMREDWQNLGCTWHESDELEDKVD